MKQKTYLLFTLFIFFLFSCGGGDQKKETKDEAMKGTSSQIYATDDGILEIELGGDWTVTQYSASGPEDHGMYAYAIESSGNIYADIIEEYSENLDEVQEVMVDGLPAVTQKRKYMVNDNYKVGRTWLIYNGKVVISLTVEAPEDKFSEDMADALLEKVTITEREDNVVLPVKAQKKYEKPEKFPKEMAESLSSLFSKDILLTDENLEKATNSVIAMQEYGEQTKASKNEDPEIIALLDSICIANGMDNWEQLQNIMSTSFTTVGVVIPGMNDIQNMQEGSLEYEPAMDMLKSTINSYNISIADVNYAYENWEKVTEFLKLLEEQ